MAKLKAGFSQSSSGPAPLGIEEVLFDNICGNGCKLHPRVDGAAGHAASTTISSSHAMDSHLLMSANHSRGLLGAEPQRLVRWISVAALRRRGDS
jgi:hypothetical protein